MPVGRLERPDQDRGGAALRLGDGVQQAVDAVGEVHVGAARWPEQRRRARGQADVGMTGGVVALVALRLDDHPAGAAEAELTADQIARDLVHGPLEEVRVQRRQSDRARSESSALRAASSCSPSDAAPVPPLEVFESSAAPSCERCVVLVVEQLGVLGDLVAIELRQRPARLERAPDEPADDAVGLAKRHPLAHQQVGEVGRRQHLVGRRRGQPLAIEAQPGEHAARRPRGRARSCRPRRTAPACPPGGPWSSSAAARAGRRPASPATRRRAADFARSSSAASGFFFCGIRLEPEEKSSAGSQNPNSWLDQMTISPPSRDRCVAQAVAA